MYSLDLLNNLENKEEEFVTQFRREKFDSFNSLPIPNWKRIRLDKFSLPKYKKYNKKYIKNNKDDLGNIVLKNISEGLKENIKLKEYLNIDDDFGVSEKFVTLGESLYNSGVIVYAPKNEQNEKPIYIEYDLDDINNFLIDHNIIVAERNSKVSVVIDYRTVNSQTKAFHNGVTKVFAKEGSEVNIIKLQRMNDISNNFDSNIAYVEGEGKVSWISVELGSLISSSSYVTNLNGEASHSDLSSIYLGDKSRKMDLGYTMVHRGARSISNIETRGALKDSSKKVFRGNLDFKKGSRRSKGVEQEFVILLDKTVKNDAIPALLCEEHDVEGEHAASAGQIDGDKLFYIMSRGLSEKEAKKLIVEASYRPIIDKIPIKELHEIITDEIHRRLVNE